MYADFDHLVEWPVVGSGILPSALIIKVCWQDPTPIAMPLKEHQPDSRISIAPPIRTAWFDCSSRGDPPRP